LLYQREETLVLSKKTMAGSTATYGTTKDSNEDATLLDDAKYSYNYSTVQTNMVQTEYAIDLLYSIPSDNKPHSIAIQKKEDEGKL
jgi:hypothetical protein